jgi:hypothetical protein
MSARVVSRSIAHCTKEARSWHLQQLSLVLIDFQEDGLSEP